MPLVRNGKEKEILAMKTLFSQMHIVMNAQPAGADDQAGQTVSETSTASGAPTGDVQDPSSPAIGKATT